MNFKQLEKMSKRVPPDLAKNYGLPFFPDDTKKELFVSDGYAAVMLPYNAELKRFGKELGCSPEPRADLYKRVTSKTAKTAVVSTFTVTAGELRRWLRRGVEGCPLCHGKKLCVVASPQTVEKRTPKYEDAYSLHYGVVGAAPVDRRRLEDVLIITEPKDTDELMLIGIAEDADYLKSIIWVRGENWRAIVMGLGEVREGESKFQVDGSYLTHKLKMPKL